MRIVIAGAGHGALVALSELARRPPRGACEILLVTEAPRATYSGMLPGWVEGLYATNEITIPVAPVAERAGARVRVAALTGLDAARREVILAGGERVGYDACVLNVGSRPRLPASPGRRDPSLLPAKPFETFRARVAPLLTGDDPVRLAVVGGGAAGVELALAFRARGRREGRSLSLALLEAGPTILPGFPGGFRERVRRRLGEAGVTVWTGARVESVAAGEARLADGRRLPVDAAVLATPGAPPDWLAPSGLALDGAGFVATDQRFASISHPEVLAVGDVGTMVDAARPKAGVWSVRAGPPLARQLGRLCAGKALAPVRLQRNALFILSLGERRAIATRNGLVAEGRWVWRWKNGLDRAFMGRFGN